MDNVLLEVKHVSKNYGATQALKDVNFSIKKGSIHSLLGRNGAGKSTVVNIIAGIHKQTSGDVLLEGDDIRSLSVFERQKIGIKIVPQHASVIPHLTVGENVFMGVWPLKKSGMVDWKKVHIEAEKELANYGLTVSTKKYVKELSSVDQRKVNIIRAMYGGAKLIILDEPTTALSTAERQELFTFVNELKEKGTAFIFISHYLQEVVELSDEVTVIRDGKSFAGERSDGSFNEENLANLVAGENVVLTQRDKLPFDENKKVMLECRNVSGKVLKDVSVKFYEGEITGVVGFPGSGARELCRTIFGLEKKTKGSFVVKNEENLKLDNPYKALDKGISYLSHDRHKEGIVGLMSIEDNISIPLLNTTLKQKNGMINKAKRAEIAKYYFSLLQMKANSTDDLLKSLSGGNQQKVVFAKSLCSDPVFIMLDEPTIGIDIKSREEIIQTVNKITTEDKKSVLYLTNDYDELVRIVDRIIFFDGGKLIKDVRNENLSHEDVIEIRDSVKDVSAKAPR